MTDKLNKNQIEDLLPHRKPMLLIEKSMTSFVNIQNVSWIPVNQKNVFLGF